jgi:hypothetical protein
VDRPADSAAPDHDHDAPHEDGPDQAGPDAADDRFRQAVTAIDAANAEDPGTVRVRGRARPKALGEAELVSEWVERLRPDAGDSLRLAARAHHLRRWTSPRSSYPDGRAGYLRWRRDLYEFHATEAGAILEAVGYDPSTIGRVQDLVRKRDLRAGTDPEVQTLEDAICLAFLEAEFVELADRLERDLIIDVLRKTLVKMSDQAKQAAATITLAPREQELLAAALAP